MGAGLGCEHCSGRPENVDPAVSVPADLKCDHPDVHMRIDGKGLPPGVEEVFAVGDEPRHDFTQLTGHNMGHCTFAPGPNLAPQPDGRLVITGEGRVVGTCGSARTAFLARKVARLAPSKGASAAGLDLLTGPLAVTVGKPTTVEALRLDVCGRMLHRDVGMRFPSTIRWSLGTCAPLLRPVPFMPDTPDGFSQPADQIQVQGVAPGSCQLQVESGGVSAKVDVTVTAP